MRKLSIRTRGEGYYEVGPAHHGPTVVVAGKNKRDALRRAKAQLRERGEFQAAGAASWRDTPCAKTVPIGTAPVTLDDGSLIPLGRKGRRQ